MSKRGGKAGQQAVGICRKDARQERGAPGARGNHVASRMSLHASAVKGTGCAGPTRAFSSVGESARLITVRSVVRIHKGPPLIRTVWRLRRASAAQCPQVKAMSDGQIRLADQGTGE